MADQPAVPRGRGTAERLLWPLRSLRGAGACPTLPRHRSSDRYMVRSALPTRRLAASSGKTWPIGLAGGHRPDRRRCPVPERDEQRLRFAAIKFQSTPALEAAGTVCMSLFAAHPHPNRHYRDRRSRFTPTTCIDPQPCRAPPRTPRAALTACPGRSSDSEAIMRRSILIAGPPAGR